MAGEAWGGDDVMLDEEGNPDIDEVELLGGKPDAEEDGWDVRMFITPFYLIFKFHFILFIYKVI